MKTTTTNRLAYTATKTTPTLRITAKIELYECGGNGNEHFALTCDAYEKSRNGRWVDSFGGCCHDEIITRWPEFAPFAALHLCDAEGAPMHAVANALYWLKGAAAIATDYGPDQSPEECARILADHLRTTPEETAALIAAAPREEVALASAIEALGLRARWKAEALAAIAQLEKLVNDKAARIASEQGTAAPAPLRFVSQATRPHFPPVDPEVLAAYRARVASGYYTPEQTAKRDTEAAQARIAAKLAEIDRDHAKATAAADAERLFSRACVLATGAGGYDSNLIYYRHTNSIACNWRGASGPRLTPERFAEIEAEMRKHPLPDGVTFEFKP